MSASIRIIFGTILVLIIFLGYQRVHGGFALKVPQAPSPGHIGVHMVGETRDTTVSCQLQVYMYKNKHIYN